MQFILPIYSSCIKHIFYRLFFFNSCTRLGLTSLSYLWRRDQEELLNEMICSGMQAILIKVAALGLEPEKHLGKSLQDVQPDLLKLVYI